MQVIRGEGGSEGAVWSSRDIARRKRRDAAWYRERAVKGNDKALRTASFTVGEYNDDSTRLPGCAI